MKVAAARRSDLRVLALCGRGEVRARLREALFGFGDVDFLGMVDDAPAAIERSRRERPDVLLVDLDQRRAELETLLAELELGPALETVGFSIVSQELQAPPGVRVIAGPPTVEGLRAVLRLRPPAPAPIAPRPPQLTRAPPYIGSILLRSKGRVQILAVAEVLWIDAARNALRIHTLAGAHRVWRSLNSLLARLDPASFLRIHRSTVVNLAAVREFRVDSQGTYAAILTGGSVRSVSRSYQPALLRRLRSVETDGSPSRRAFSGES